MAVVFDGPSLEIRITTTGNYDVQNELYSDWKEFVQLSDNSKFPKAFDTTGGDPISGSQNIAPYFFLRNDLGWRIIAPEATGDVIFTGNLFPRDSAFGSLFVAPGGAFTVLFQLTVSPQALTLGSGLTVSQSAALERIDKLARNKMTIDPGTGVLTVYDDNGTTVLLTANVFEDVAATQAYRGLGTERRERLV